MKNPHIIESSMGVKNIQCAICDGFFAPDKNQRYRKSKNLKTYCSKKCGIDGRANTRFIETIEQVFWRNVKAKSVDECWEWEGGKNAYGYGSVRYKQKHYIASRLAWIIIKGKIPKDMHVLHKCDNPPCCNPHHLWIGTHSDNIQDMWDKGRHIKCA